MVRCVNWMAAGTFAASVTACASGSTAQPPGFELPQDDDDDGGESFGPINPTTTITTFGGSGQGEVDDTGADTTGGPMDTGDTTCGDGVTQPSEKCDGSDLGGEDCMSQGFDEGTLACNADCAGFDTSACILHECGNGLIDGEEFCDGPDLAGADCQSEGFDAGELGCRDDCTALVTDGCSLFSCGNASVEGTEVCDGTDLGGETCASQGLEGGTLACAANCADFDLGACLCQEQSIGGMQGAGVASGTTIAEDDSLPTTCGSGGGADRVIGFTAPSAGDYVFDTLGSDYDTVLAVFAGCNPASEIECSDDAVDLTSSVALTLASGQSVVLVVDGFSGDTGNWVLNINAAVNDCFEQDLMSNLGAPASSGTTVGEDEDFVLSCGGATGSVDRVVRFSAPATATFTFDTAGSGYDTVLAAFDTCDVTSELACNDDTVNLTSEISVDLTVGQEIFLAISGFSGATGAWVLNASQG